jgi:hypothetical protein
VRGGVDIAAIAQGPGRAGVEPACRARSTTSGNRGRGAGRGGRDSSAVAQASALTTHGIGPRDTRIPRARAPGVRGGMY